MKQLKPSLLIRGTRKWLEGKYLFAKKYSTNHPKTNQNHILSMAKKLIQATWFIPWKFKSKIYTYINFQQCNFRQKKWQKKIWNKTISPQEIYLRCVCVLNTDLVSDYSSFWRGEINWKKIKINPQIIHYSSKLYCALACGAVGWRFFLGRANPLGIKRCYTTMRTHRS